MVLMLFVIFQYHLVNWCKLKIHAIGVPSDFMWVYTCYQSTEGLQTVTVKIELHEIVILNSHITVIYLRFIRNTYFYVVQQKN